MLFAFGCRHRRQPWTRSRPEESIAGSQQLALPTSARMYGNRCNEFQLGLTNEDRHLAHDARVGDDGSDESFIVTFAPIGIGIAEGQ